MKKVYETPFTTHVRVEMESQLCAASSTVTNPDNTNGRIDEQSTQVSVATSRVLNGILIPQPPSSN